MVQETPDHLQQLKETAQWLQQRGIDAEFGVVLGTGLHALVNRVGVVETIPYSDIPHFPVSTVEFHQGNLVYGNLAGKKVLLMQGRFHLYEGYTMQQVIFPVRVMKLLGVKYLLLTNAAGGINLDYKKGDLVLIDDHINLQTGNPLTGQNFNELGSRFTDMSQPYDRRITACLVKQAALLSITLPKGVYAAVNGPNLETKAEYRYLKIIGADLVGMSTVPEVLAANHMGLPCAAISVVTDECDPDNLQPVNISEIIEVAMKADEKLAMLLEQTILSL